MKIFSSIRKVYGKIRYSQAELFVKRGGKIGKGSEFHGKVVFGSEPYLIEIGDNVRFADGVIFSTHDGGMWVLRNLGLLPGADNIARIKVGNNVQIGYRAIINQGVTIGDNCIIASGSIVTHDIPSNSICAGIPAKVIETIDDYYQKRKETCVFTKNMDKKEKKAYLLEHIK
nr:acyltransferase [uncultured Ruminococcus sp.]